jgi:tRNA-dihydrouridine synthase
MAGVCNPAFRLIAKEFATHQDAKRLLDETGVDGVMIGRGALGDPWMLYRTIQCLETGELLPNPSAREKVEVCLLHMERLIKVKGEHIAVKEMRKQAAWYLKGLKGSKEVRKIVNVCEAADELRHVLLAFVEEIEAMEAAS